MATPTLTIVDDNDYVEIAGPVRGRDPVTGERVLYHGEDVVAFIAQTSGSNTPFGGLTHDCVEIGATGKYGAAFDGAAITSALTGLADGTVLYRVFRSPGNFRVENPITYRKTRPAD